MNGYFKSKNVEIPDLNTLTCNPKFATKSNISMQFIYFIFKIQNIEFNTSILFILCYQRKNTNY